MRLADRIVADEAQGVFIIDGYRVSEAVISEFTRVTQPGRWFRIVSREDGVITVETKQEEQ